VAPRASGPVWARIPPTRRPIPAARPPPTTATRAAAKATVPWAAKVRRSISFSARPRVIVRASDQVRTRNGLAGRSPSGLARGLRRRSHTLGARPRTPWAPPGRLLARPSAHHLCHQGIGRDGPTRSGQEQRYPGEDENDVGTRVIGTRVEADGEKEHERQRHPTGGGHPGPQSEQGSQADSHLGQGDQYPQGHSHVHEGSHQRVDRGCGGPPRQAAPGSRPDWQASKKPGLASFWRPAKQKVNPRKSRRWQQDPSGRKQGTHGGPSQAQFSLRGRTVAWTVGRPV
jgi:hypothetical protein